MYNGCYPCKGEEEKTYHILLHFKSNLIVVADLCCVWSTVGSMDLLLEEEEENLEISSIVLILNNMEGEYLNVPEK